jgi:phage terminase small subunit
MPRLSDKRKMFAKEYSVSFNATQAAIKAGYAKKGAAREGHRLSTNVHVRAEINRLIEKRKDKIDITEQEIIAHALKILKTDPAELAQAIEKGDDLSELCPELIQEITISRNSGVNGSGSSVKVRMPSKDRALELLAKYKAMLTDRTELTGDEQAIEEIRKAHDRRKRLEKKKNEENNDSNNS